MDAAAPIFFSSISALRYPSIIIPTHRTGYLCRRPRLLSTINKPATLLNRNHNNVPSTSSSRASAAAAAVNEEISSAIITTTTDPEISWQIVIGVIAGVTPFVVAGIEFTKRIVKQKKCKVCKGSGLVLRDNKYYFRCPGCGGFLPWQSWRRFFTG